MQYITDETYILGLCTKKLCSQFFIVLNFFLKAYNFGQ